MMATVYLKGGNCTQIPLEDLDIFLNANAHLTEVRCKTLSRKMILEEYSSDAARATM